MSTLTKTEVFYTDSNNVFQGKRHAVIQRDEGDFYPHTGTDGKTRQVYIPTNRETHDQPTITTVQLAGEIFYATGKTGTNHASGLPVLELASHKPDGTATGRRIWATTDGNNVFAD